MTFVQLMEYTTARQDEVRRVTDEWESATRGKRTARRVVLSTHHDQPDRYCVLVFFDSYDAARENSSLPETDEFATRLRELVDGEVSFVDLDVVEDRQL